MKLTHTVRATCLVLLAATVSAHARPPILLAHSVPLSGQLASVGKLQSIAVDLAVEDVNKAGGINGSKIEILRFDDQLKPDQGVLRVREAAQKGAFAILGPMSSTQWETAAPTINQLKLPAINMNANKSGTVSRPYGTRLNTPDDVAIAAGFEKFMKMNPGIKRIVVIGDVREAAGKAAIDEWTKLSQTRKLEIAGRIEFTSGQSDFSAVAIKLKQLNPDAIFAGIISGDAVKLARELQMQQVTMPIVCTMMIWPGVFPQTVTKLVGAQAGQWHVIGSTSNDRSSGDPAAFKAFVTRFSAGIAADRTLAQFQPPNVANSGLGYDAVMLVAEVLRKAGVSGATPVEEAREKLKTGILATRKFTSVDTIALSEEGNGSQPIDILQVDAASSTWKFVPAK